MLTFDSSVARVEPEQDKEYIYYSEDKELLVKEVQSAKVKTGLLTVNYW